MKESPNGFDFPGDFNSNNKSLYVFLEKDETLIYNFQSVRKEYGNKIYN